MENRVRRRQNGSGLVEFAFGFGVLVVLFMGLLQVAYSVVVFSQLSGAVRSAARYAAGVEFDEPGHRFVEQIQNVAAYGLPSPPADSRRQAPDLAPNNIDVTWTRDAAGVPDTITVSVRGYRIPLLGKHELSGHPRFTVHYTGEWVTPVTASRRH